MAGSGRIPSGASSARRRARRLFRAVRASSRSAPGPRLAGGLAPVTAVAGDPPFYLFFKLGRGNEGAGVGRGPAGEPGDGEEGDVPFGPFGGDAAVGEIAAGVDHGDPLGPHLVVQTGRLADAPGDGGPLAGQIGALPLLQIVPIDDRVVEEAGGKALAQGAVAPLGGVGDEGGGEGGDAAFGVAGIARLRTPRERRWRTMATRSRRSSRLSRARRRPASARAGSAAAAMICSPSRPKAVCWSPRSRTASARQRRA